MAKVIKNGKISYEYDIDAIKRRGEEKKKIDYDHIVARSTQEGLEQLEFVKEQINRLQRQINYYNQIRREIQLQIYGN
ncbi:MAG TPA: hypothetical protein VL728_19635 [Cyclobacteriaceae bacterium]|jgi:hypothetical protein|nr:hypothetical protein [Cyclobacteriaceae bacterium]